MVNTPLPQAFKSAAYAGCNMKRLRAQIPIHSSTDEAMSGIEAFFDSIRDVDGVARFRLRVPVKGTAGSLGLYIDRQVWVEARRTRDDDNLNDVIRVAWKSEGSAIFPVFRGVLVSWSDGDPKNCFVELDGEYDPPLGVTGEAFDEIIGHQIAEATAHEFLVDIKRAVEAREIQSS